MAPNEDNLLLTSGDLEKEYRLRKKKRIEDVLSIGTEIPAGWNMLQEYKTKVRIYKEKPINQLLEDKVWLLLHDIGAEKLSANNFKLTLRKTKNEEKTKQLDIVAVDGDIVFVVECKSKVELGPKSLKKEIAEYAGNKSRIEGAIRNLLNIRGIKFIHIFATENIIWNGNDQIDAKEVNIQIMG